MLRAVVPLRSGGGMVKLSPPSYCFCAGMNCSSLCPFLSILTIYNIMRKLGIERNSSILWGATLVVAAFRVVVPVLRESSHGRYQWAEVLNTAYSLYRFGEWKDPFAALPTGP